MSVHSHIELPETTVKVLRILEDAGYEAWCVGGFVRDALMGYPGGDVDVATSARCEQTVRVFREAGYRTIETGIAYGTVCVIADGKPFEITTYRTDGAYRDGRHPDSVSFISSIEEDLARRDFTMNAIAYHPTRGLLDPFGGSEDIVRRTIRTVGDPTARFRQDALRILRGVRFVSKLGFDLDPDTYAAMRSCVGQLAGVSSERIAKEMDGILCGARAHQALMAAPDIVSFVIPELGPCWGFDQHTPWHIYDVYEHIAYVVQASPATPFARWCALMHDIAKPQTFQLDANGRGHFPRHPSVSADIARSVLTRMRKPSRFIDDAVVVVRWHDTPMHPASTPVRRALRNLDGRIDLMNAIIDLKIADNRSKNHQAANASLQRALDLRRVLESVLERGEPYLRGQLAINGRDLMELGLEPGPELGSVLDQLLDAVIDGSLENSYEALCAAACAFVA